MKEMKSRRQMLRQEEKTFLATGLPCHQSVLNRPVLITACAKDEQPHIHDIYKTMTAAYKQYS